MIQLCEDLSDSRAQVTTVPTWLLKRVRGLLQSLQWAKDAADRLVRGVLCVWGLAAWQLGVWGVASLQSWD